MKRHRQFTISEMLMLILSICTWLAITVQLGSASILFWGLAISMAAWARR